MQSFLPPFETHNKSYQTPHNSFKHGFRPRATLSSCDGLQVHFILGDPGAVSGGGKKAKRARKKIGRGKVKKESRSPWDSSLNRPVPKPFKILACDWAQKYFCAQSESSSFRVTFVTSYSKVFTAKLFARLFATTIRNLYLESLSISEQTLNTLVRFY